MTAADSSSNQFCSVVFPEIGPVSWADKDELLLWLGLQLDGWNWLPSALSPEGNELFGRMLKEFENLKLVITSITAEDGTTSATGVISQLQSMLLVWANKFPGILPGSAFSEFIKSLRSTHSDNLAAIVTVLDMVGTPIRSPLSSSPQLMLAYCELTLFNHGLNASALDATQHINNAANSYTTKLNELEASTKESLSKLKNEHRLLLTKSTSDTDEKLAQIKRLADEYREKLDEGNQQISDIFGAATAQLANLTDAYGKKIALEAPVKFWEEKRKAHRVWAWVSGSVTIAAMIFAGCFLAQQLNNVDKLFAERAAQLNALASSKTATAQEISKVISSMPNWHIQVAMLVLLATLVLWGLRLLVRLFLSQIHLGNDAAERVTMAQTYISLLAQDGAPKGEQLQVILNALFRSSGDGIVKDEGVPPVLMEMLTRTK